MRWTGEKAEHEQGRLLLPGPGLDRGRAWAATSPRRFRPRWTSSGAGARRPGSTSSVSASTPTPRSSYDTAVQQPALVATSLAMLAALHERGIKADFVIGHSVGEFAALAAAEAMTIEEAIALVRERGLAMADAAARNPGSMAAILGLADEVVEGLCRKILGVWPANYNCPGQVVVSGEDLAVLECIEQAQSRRRPSRRQAQGLGCVPLAARRARRRPAASGDREGEVSRSRLRRSCPP